MSPKRRSDYDLLRVLSMLGVVYLHTAAGALRHPENPAVWHFSNLVTALATTAVPLFFMLSGALLLSRPETADPRVIFRRRLPKVLLPLLAWSGIIILLTSRETRPGPPPCWSICSMPRWWSPTGSSTPWCPCTCWPRC